MKGIILLIFTLGLVGCATIEEKIARELKDKTQIQEFTLAPGKPVYFSMNFPEQLKRPNFYCGEESIGFHLENGEIKAYLAMPYDLKEASQDCYLELSELKEHLVIVRLIKGPFPYKLSHLKVKKKHVELDQDAIDRWLKETAQLKEVYRLAEMNRPLFQRPFIRPLNSITTSPYGTKRVFNDMKESWHNGVDLRAYLNTPVPASNDGKVVFAGSLYFNGNTVIIDHGMGVMTLYCHLNKINVNVGDVVTQSQILGLSGNTGRSNGPHLHWGTRIQSEWVDGEAFLKLVSNNQAGPQK